MEEMFSILNSIPFVGMAIYLIKKYTFTIILSTILSLYLFYYHKSLGKYILLSFFISVPILVILKIYVESNPDRILLYTNHPLMRIFTIYVLFGMTYFAISSQIENIIKKIKTSKLYGWLKNRITNPL
ncbi:uncharacterized protein METZ01_LOCUS326032 [marine metagenome]|uniref:Uncharacterized protein n=1 Tax=marine metagenome TaxID=408172 RepID=A0A382PKI4_9ZZZZ